MEYRLTPGEVEVHADGYAEPLTRREREILACLLAGKSDKEIVEKLHIGLGTVHAHLANIYPKLGVHGRGEAIAKFLGLPMRET